MELITLLRSAKNGVFICREGEPAFADVLTLLAGKADAAFKEVTRTVEPGMPGRCSRIQLENGLTRYGEQLLADLEKAAIG